MNIDHRGNYLGAYPAMIIEGLETTDGPHYHAARDEAELHAAAVAIVRKRSERKSPYGYYHEPPPTPERRNSFGDNWRTYAAAIYRHAEELREWQEFIELTERAVVNDGAAALRALKMRSHLANGLDHDDEDVTYDEDDERVVIQELIVPDQPKQPPAEPA
jgi:hypothetical protein